jgi:N utilization substance protein A
MSKEILLVVDSVSNEKGVSKDIIFDALELALATATKKRYGDDAELRVKIDQESGEYETYRRWLLIEDDAEMEFPSAQMTVSAAQIDEPNLQVGDYVEELVDSVACTCVSGGDSATLHRTETWHHMQCPSTSGHTLAKAV